MTNIQFPDGGYPYTKHVPSDEQDFYFYPIKDAMTRKDSLIAAFYQPQLNEGFDEKNLSLTPPKNPTFRLTFTSGYLGYVAILTLTPNSIIIKEIQSDTTANSGGEKLDSLEREHLQLLNQYYPFAEYKIKYSNDPYRIKYLDSVAIAYPQLLKPRYYLSLLTKADNFNLRTMSYKQWAVSISQEAYKKIVDSINHSGFWKMNYFENPCPGDATHPDELLLEAATPEKYQAVSYKECTNPTSLQRALEALMEEGGLDKSFERWTKDAIMRARINKQKG